MKRIISTLLVCVLLLGCVFTLASCGKRLSGSYSHKEEAYGQSVESVLTFKGKTVTIETKITVAGNTTTNSIEGTYEIDDDKIKITFEEDGESITQDLDFEKGKGYIKIDDTKYDKVKK